ncbi:MAG: helix-turn-helix domain-containing protein [Nitrososphaerales archaeon]|nr:helix-turn-helix domain-containing protein [Nitrososphaerales archaeon]
MNDNESFELLASRSRLRIAALLSTRPRTLGELANETGVSVQAVLKHLEKLNRLGILEKRKISGKSISVRKLYSIKGAHVGNFSTGDITIVSVTKRQPAGHRSKDPVGEMQNLAEDVLVQKRRIREQARKLGREIGELVESEERLNGLVQSLDLDDEERLVLLTAFTEETLEDAEKALARTHGLTDPRRSLERAIGKARRVGKK